MTIKLCFSLLTRGLLLGLATSVLAQPCRIEVVEKGSGWPVPLVELRTTHSVRFVTDNAGVIALDLPECMGRETWFDVIGHGYEVPKDGFGSRGVRLKPEPGKTLKVEVNRTIVAKRIGRLTGNGLFAESQKLGRELDWRDSDVFGCDSVQNAVHRRENVLGLGRYDHSELSTRDFRHVERDDGDSAAEVIRAAAEVEVRLFHRREKQTARRGEDAGRGPDLGHGLHEFAGQGWPRAIGRLVHEDSESLGDLRVGLVRVE